MKIGIERAVAPKSRQLVRMSSDMLHPNIQKFIPNHPCLVWVDHFGRTENSIYIMNLNNPALQPYDKIAIQH